MSLPPLEIVFRGKQVVQGKGSGLRSERRAVVEDDTFSDFELPRIVIELLPSSGQHRDELVGHRVAIDKWLMNLSEHHAALRLKAPPTGECRILRSNGHLQQWQPLVDRGR